MTTWVRLPGDFLERPEIRTLSRSDRLARIEELVRSSCGVDSSDSATRDAR